MHETARRARDSDPSVSRVDDDVISDNAVGATETDSVSPFLERIRATRADIVVLNGSSIAGEWAFGEVKARPRARII